MRRCRHRAFPSRGNPRLQPLVPSPSVITQGISHDPVLGWKVLASDPRPTPSEVSASSVSIAWKSAAPTTGSEAGSYFRLIDSCIAQRKAQGPNLHHVEIRGPDPCIVATQLETQGPSRTCHESKDEEKEGSDPCKMVSLLMQDLLGPVTDPRRHPLHRNVQWFRGGLVFDADRLLHHSAQGPRTF